MIDPTTFEYKDNRWQDLYTFLKSKGFDVYSPGQHVGECKSPYVVVRYDVTTQITNASSHWDLYAVMCYVPQNQYSKLETLTTEVRIAMEELRPMFLKFYEQTSMSAYDEAARAHYTSTEYRNAKKD